LAPPDHRAGLRRRLAILSRAVAAVVGGYALASVFAVACAVLPPGARADAVLAGMLSSFAIYVGAFLWAFAASSALRAWLGLLLPAALLAGATLLALSRSVS
jgi:hypothetical protein